MAFPVDLSPRNIAQSGQVSSTALHSASPAVASAAQTAFSDLATPVSANPFALVSKSSPLSVTLAQPQFTDEQAKFVDGMLRANPVAAAQLPFVHLLHLAIFRHAHALKQALNTYYDKAGMIDKFAASFNFVNPYRKISLAFLLLYANHRNPALVKDSAEKVLGKKFMGLAIEGELMIKNYQRLIDGLKRVVRPAQILLMETELASLKLAWGALNEFSKSVGPMQCDQLFLRLQKGILAMPPTPKESAAALQKLAGNGFQALVEDYLSFASEVEPLKGLGVYRTQSFPDMAKKNGLDTIFALHGLTFVQESICGELQHVVDQLSVPENVIEVQRELDCEDMTQEQISQAFETTLALQDSVRSLNASVGAITTKIASLDDPSHKNSKILETQLDELAGELGIQRAAPEPELPESVRRVIDQLDVFQVSALSVAPSPSQQDASTHESAPFVEPSPTHQQLSQDETAPFVQPSPANRETPSQAQTAIPATPRTPPPKPRSLREQAQRARDFDDDKKVAPVVVSPPRIRRGMNLRKILKEFKRKGIQVVRHQDGSHRQLSTRNTLAVHSGATIGPRAAKKLSQDSVPK